MATFLMIHGAWHGGWCFDLMRPLFEGRGHRMVAPTLPGMGSGDATLDGWVDFVVDTAGRQPEPVILCGHSRGGIVISQAAEQAPEAFSALVYLAAFLLPSGRSFVEEVDAYPRDPLFENGVHPADDGRSLTIATDVAKQILYNQTPAEAAAMACARLVNEPIAPAIVPITTSHERYGSVPHFYIECLRDRALRPAHQRLMYENAGCEQILAIDSDHSPFLSAPEALVDALCKIAAVIAARSLPKFTENR